MNVPIDVAKRMAGPLVRSDGTEVLKERYLYRLKFHDDDTMLISRKRFLDHISRLAEQSDECDFRKYHTEENIICELAV